jgi:hypothetical protein
MRGEDAKSRVSDDAGLANEDTMSTMQISPDNNKIATARSVLSRGDFLRFDEAGLTGTVVGFACIAEEPGAAAYDAASAKFEPQIDRAYTGGS